MRFTALGVNVETRSGERDVQFALTRLFAGFDSVPNGAPPDVVYMIEHDGSLWTLFRDRHVLRRAEKPLPLLHWLVHDLNHVVVERTAHVTLHAGGVVQAGAILLPAKMESGKTTLTAGLVRAGLGYLSDEAIAIDRATGQALPFPKPLSLDVGSRRFFPELREPIEGGFESQWHVPPDDLRPGAVGTPSPVRLIIFPRYESGAATRLEPVGRGEALVALAENTFRFDTRARTALDVLAGIVRDVPCYRLVTGDLAPAVAAVLQVAGIPPPSIDTAAA